MNNKTLALLIVCCSLIGLVACERLTPQAPDSSTVLDSPVDGLSAAQLALFLRGDEEFGENYTPETGLGPLFVSQSCESCHAGDGRGHFSTVLTRFGQSDTSGNTFLAKGGPQLQHRALPGFAPEELPAGASSSRFIAPIAAGVGFLELVSDSSLLALSDPNDLNADGISGVPNWNTIPSYVDPFSGAVQQGNKYICRFGRKAGTYNVFQQAVQAFNQDIGITTTFLPKNPSNYKEGLEQNPVSEPDITDQAVNSTVFYLRCLNSPPRRNEQDATVQSGAAVFAQIGCENCHTETLKTGYSPIAALSNVSFHPYTDLLLHDMGPGLDDGYTEGSAKTSEWRTTPLWGLGLAEDAQGGKIFLLHDGRATSIEQAIELHGGEANNSVNQYKALSATDKAALIKFLKSL